MSVSLTCHAETPSTVVRGLSARVARRPSGSLQVSFSLDTDVRQLRIPPLRPPRRADRLWEHTCFELFVAGDVGSAYQEFNFSPSREWAVFGFQSYRNREPIDDSAVAPDVTVLQSTRRFELDALVSLVEVPALHAQARLRLGLAAVIEEAGGARSYWALRHPPGRPDFHHRDGFVLCLSAAGVDSLDNPR